MSIGNKTYPNNPNIQLQFKGWQQSRTTEALRTTVTVQSTKEKLTGAVGTGNYIVGASYMGQQTYGKDLGVLEEIKISQDSGPFWNMTLSYNNPLSTSITTPTSTISADPTQNSLAVVMLSMPIETHPNYIYRWNHALMGCCLSASEISTITGIALTAKLSAAEALINDESYKGRLKWIKSPDQIPTEKETVTMPNDSTSAGYWKVIVGIKKPGVESYDLPTYEIQQKAKHNKRQDASWALTQINGKIAFPKFGDFGIQGYFHTLGQTPRGYWLCQGGGIEFDGKNYVTNCTYLYSPDPNRWDLQIYDFATSYADYKNKSSNGGKNKILIGSFLH